MNDMKRLCVIGTLLTGLALASSVNLSAQDVVSNHWPDYLIPNGTTVYDAVNGVTWLTDADLAASVVADSADDPATSLDTPPRFGLPLCNPDSTDDCIWPDGAMSYTSAQKWVKRMNAASYLGHDNWQLPSTPLKDSGCSSKGPSNNNFGFGCSAGALGSLYYVGMGITAPNTAVPIPPNTVGPFLNFQPATYWSHSKGGGLADSIANFSFADGAQGGTNTFNYAYVLPLIKGRIPGKKSPSTNTSLELSDNGLTVYDPVADVTWAANANLAAQQPFSLKACKTPRNPAPCVAADGSMNYPSAEQFIADMNAATTERKPISNSSGSCQSQIPDVHNTTASREILWASCTIPSLAFRRVHRSCLFQKLQRVRSFICNPAITGPAKRPRSASRASTAALRFPIPAPSSTFPLEMGSSALRASRARILSPSISRAATFPMQKNADPQSRRSRPSVRPAAQTAICRIAENAY